MSRFVLSLGINSGRPVYVYYHAEARRIRRRLDYFEEFSDQDFRERFRLSKDTVRAVVGVLGDAVTPSTERLIALSAEQLVHTILYAVKSRYSKVVRRGPKLYYVELALTISQYSAGIQFQHNWQHIS